MSDETEADEIEESSQEPGLDAEPEILPENDAVFPPGVTAKGPSEAFRYVHTPELPAMLESLGITLMVTTYQAGKLLVFRVQDGKLKMLVRTFDRAMGLAVSQDRMAIGTGFQVWQLRNSPDTAARLKPAGAYDACYMPRTCHVTGGIDGHEMAWIRDTNGQRRLLIVNTLFSCLCTIDQDHSFMPRWKPPFVSEIIRQDRCHLNGLCVVDGKAKYVTAFGQTDQAEGWRPGKVDGGIVMDVASGEVVTEGLSMPHSPRVHNGKLWVLDSGRGELVHVDPTSGKRETVAKLPGYTRGLAMAGRYAFVGLSKIREKKTFGGVPIEAELSERKCGVSVVDLPTGNVVGFLEFEGNIAELFDVQVLPGVRFPAVLGFQKPTIRRACVIAPETPLP